MQPDSFDHGHRISEAPEAIGDFYTIPHECIVCGAPAAMAPDILAHHRTLGHCYFIKQPSNGHEFQQLMNAVDASCVGNIYYRGHDPEILRTFRHVSPGSLSQPYFVPINEMNSKPDVSERPIFTTPEPGLISRILKLFRR